MPRYFPNLDEFRSIAKSADLVPVYRQLLADRFEVLLHLRLALGGGKHTLELGEHGVLEPRGRPLAARAHRKK